MNEVAKRSPKSSFDIQPDPGAEQEILSNPGSAEQARPAVSEEQIAERAYALYEARGREHGHDLDDWLQAQRELEGI